MGAGRKTQTFKLGERPLNAACPINASVTARNLRKNDLGGVVFGCTRYTMTECLSNQIFGLPSLHFSYIKNIDPGLPLFLFNYSDRQLHGIFQAASPGQLNINPYGWSAGGSERTLYPAQVRIHVRMHCKPLSENQYKPIILDNYHSPSHFWFELDHAQTGALISLFESVPVQRVPKLQTQFKPAFEYEKRPQSTSKGNLVQLNSSNTCFQNKWNMLFVSTPDTEDTSEDEEDSRQSVSEADAPHSYPSSSSVATPYKDGIENQMLQPHIDEAGVDDEVDVIYKKLQRLMINREHAKSNPEEDEENRPAASEVIVTLSEDECPSESPMSSEENSEDVPVNFSDSQSPTDQLRQEVEELKVSSLEQLQKITSLEEKLMESDIQVEQLQVRIEKLEFQMISSTIGVDEPVNKSKVSTDTLEEWFDETRLDANGLVFLIGGYDGHSWLSSLDCYSLSRDTMKSLKPMSSDRSYSAAAALNGDIYVFGGRNGHLWYDTVESYNPLKNEWTPRPALFQKKGCLAGVTLQDKIFAVGGGNGVDCFADVEMFDPVVGRWFHTQSMREKRFSCAAAELNGVIYTVGGFDGRNYLKSAERFDPREISWSRLPSMNTNRGCHSLVVLKEKLYALGGYDGAKMVQSVDVFDPRTGSWTAADELKESRIYSVAAVVGESIFLISGLKEGMILSETVECFNERSGWSVINVKGLGKRSFSSGIVL